MCKYVSEGVENIESILRDESRNRLMLIFNSCTSIKDLLDVRKVNNKVLEYEVEYVVDSNGLGKNKVAAIVLEGEGNKIIDLYDVKKYNREIENVGKSILCFIEGDPGRIENEVDELYELVGGKLIGVYVGGDWGENIKGKLVFLDDDDVSEFVDSMYEVSEGMPLLVSKANDNRVKKLISGKASEEFRNKNGNEGYISNYVGIPYNKGDMLVRRPIGIEIYEEGSVEFLGNVPQNTLLFPLYKEEKNIKIQNVEPGNFNVVICSEEVKRDYEKYISEFINKCNKRGSYVIGITSKAEISSMLGVPLVFNNVVIIVRM